jgi:hypothetical protein
MKTLRNKNCRRSQWIFGIVVYSGHWRKNYLYLPNAKTHIERYTLPSKTTVSNLSI